MSDSFISNIRSSRRAIVYALVALLVSLPAASAATATVLIIQVRTDLIPGSEFGWVRSKFHQLADDGSMRPENAVIDRWVHHSEGADWGAGVLVAEGPQLPNAEYRGVVSIYTLEGGLLVSRPIRVELIGGVHVVTVLLTREPDVTPPQPGFLPGTETSHWTSDEFDTGNSKDPIQCPVNLAMHGLGCNGNFCDNVRLHCRAVAGVSTQNHRWTTFFSDESASFQGCNSNEFATGLECRGAFCDEISLRCTEHNATEEFCYVTDPISEELPFNDFSDPTNGYLRRILCQGSNCNDKRLEICRIVQFPLNLGAFSNLCVTSVGGIMKVATCQSAENDANGAQVWKLDLKTGQMINPLTGTCLTAIGGIGSVTEEPCVEAGDTSWFMDGKGRLASLGPNNDPLCLSVVGVQDPFGVPPLGAVFELGICSDALYQLFEASNAALPPPLPEIDAGFGDTFPVPGLLLPAGLLLIGAVSIAGASLIRRG